MNAALIGFGRWGRSILPILKSLETQLSMELRYICSPLRSVNPGMRDRYPEIEWFEDFESLLRARPQLDAVFIATPLATHYALAKRSLECGCHTFVEKPFVHLPEQARELATLARQASLVLLVGHRLLYSPALQWLKQAVFPAGVTQKVAVEAAWKNWGVHQAGGVHWDLGVHYIAVMHYLAATPLQVVAVAPLWTGRHGTVESISIVLGAPNGSTFKIDASWNHPVRVKELLVKTADRLIWVDHGSDAPLVVVRAEATEGLGDGRRYTATVTGREGFGRDAFDEMQTIETELEDFAGAIRTGGDVLASSALAIEVTDTLEKIDAALR